MSDVSRNLALAQEGKAPVLTLQGIYEREGHFVFNAIRRLGIPAKDQEDAMQEVFVRVSEKLSTYESHRPLRGWLFGIAFNVASEYERRAPHRKEELTDDVPEGADPGPLPDDILESAQRQSLVRQAVLEIPLRRRAVFVLHELEGLSVSEISEAFGLPVFTAYTRLRKARQEFRAAILQLISQGPR